MRGPWLRARESARFARSFARPRGFEPLTTGFEGLYKGTASDMPNGKTAAECHREISG